ncbi:hypothetical protein BGW80DRAFT_1461640 [Lactifluus volemus]|nr:hypothetical protein BGW80DRAFT_1461640 [Lactifluus volemus]
MSTAPAAPLKKQRLIFLSLSLLWCIIGGSIGLNGLIKLWSWSNQARTDIQEGAPSGVIVHVNILGIFVNGVVITAACAIIALLAAISILVTVVWPESATRSLKAQAGFFNTFNMAVLSNEIVYTAMLATNRAQITAFLDGVELSPQAVQLLITATGQSYKYSEQHPAVLLAIFPWIPVLFTSILVVILYVAARRRDRPHATLGRSSPDSEKTLIYKV